MASSDASALSQWARFFGGASADIFEVIDAAVAVATLHRPAELKQRRELIAQRLYNASAGIDSCGDAADDSSKDSFATPVKGRRPVGVAASKKDGAPSPSASSASAEKGTAPVKNQLARKDCSVRPHSAKPPSAAAIRDRAPTQLSEQSMEAMLAATKRRLHEGYEEYKDAKRQRRIQVIEAPELAKQRRKSQHPIILRRDEVRCVATAAERRAMMSSLRSSWI